MGWRRNYCAAAIGEEVVFAADGVDGADEAPQFKTSDVFVISTLRSHLLSRWSDPLSPAGASAPSESSAAAFSHTLLRP
jgi:hypothetical protein